MTPLIIYHGGCRDGWAAAWVCHKRFPDAEFHAGHYGQEPPSVAGRDVMIVDFSYPREDLVRMWTEASSLRVLDHHKSAMADLVDLDFATFDMERSGAMMAWDYLFPRALTAPWLVKYVQDRDLWRWHLRKSRQVNAYISTIPFTFEDWDYVNDTETTDDAERAGHYVNMKIAQYCSEVAKNASISSMWDMTIPVVCAPQCDISELLEYLMSFHSSRIAVGWFQRADGLFQYSIRTRGDLDASALAKQYGGGGHMNAAGFQVPFPVHLFDLEKTDERH